jgi:hypothetical protein
VRAVEDYCRGRLRAIYRHPKVVEWLKQPITLEEKDKDGNPKSYAERVAEIVKMLSLSNPQLHEFFLNHATQAAPKIRAAALQAALLFNLKDIALGTYSVERILEEAEGWLRRIVELNLASIANIVEEYEGKRELNVKALFESLPNYAKAVIAVAEAYRRLVLEEYRGKGQVPDELRDVVLDNLKVGVEEYGYEYLSRALDIVKRRKRALEELNNAGFSLRLKFTLIEPQKQIKATVLDWSEQPISIPKNLTRRLAECSSFRQFRHFVSVSEEESQPPAREYAESIPSGSQVEHGNKVSPRRADEMTKLTKDASSNETNQTVRQGEFNVPLKEDAGSVRSENAETEKHMLAEFAEMASDEKTKKEAPTQAEAAARLLEFVGKEGKPLMQVFEYVVKELKILKPEPLLKELLERGHLVKVKKGGGAPLQRLLGLGQGVGGGDRGGGGGGSGRAGGGCGRRQAGGGRGEAGSRGGAAMVAPLPAAAPPRAARSRQGEGRDRGVRGGRRRRPARARRPRDPLRRRALARGGRGVTAVVRFCKDCAHFAEGRCELAGWRALPTRPACAGFAARGAQPQRPAAPLTSTIPAPPPRFRRVISLCRRRPVRRKPDYFAYTVNVPIDAVRAWAGGGEPPRKLMATFDGRRLVLEPLEGVVGE